MFLLHSSIEASSTETILYVKIDPDFCKDLIDELGLNRVFNKAYC
jgi:hypothetical protein